MHINETRQTTLAMLRFT